MIFLENIQNRQKMLPEVANSILQIRVDGLSRLTNCVWQKIRVEPAQPEFFFAAREPIHTTISHQDTFLSRKNRVEPTLLELLGEKKLYKVDSCPKKDFVH